MINFPNCKINLGLNVIAKRADGFHDIESVFIPVPLCDVLEIVAAEDGVFKFTSSGLTIGGEPEDNICVRAWRLVDHHIPLPPVHIHLHKVIPAGSGLGGGSSDGAFVINCLDKLFDLALTRDQKMVFAAQLGSDCSFFIDNRPVFVTGRGDILTGVDIDLEGNSIVIVHPGIHVSTPCAYSKISPRKTAEVIPDIIGLPMNEWKGKLINDFEHVVTAEHPVISQILAELYQMGAVYASMSGSGSAVYGIFSEPASLDNRFTGMFCWQGRL